VTLWDARDVFDYWRRVPPIHHLVAGYFGFKPGPRERARLLRGEAANDENQKGAEALMRFMDATAPMLTRT
jgi:hypothetical protein